MATVVSLGVQPEHAECSYDVHIGERSWFGFGNRAITVIITRHNGSLMHNMTFDSAADLQERLQSYLPTDNDGRQREAKRIVENLVCAYSNLSVKVDAKERETLKKEWLLIDRTCNYLIFYTALCDDRRVDRFEYHERSVVPPLYEIKDRATGKSLQTDDLNSFVEFIEKRHKNSEITFGQMALLYRFCRSLSLYPSERSLQLLRR